MLAKGQQGQYKWAGFEDDWAIANYGDIFVKDFFPKWFKDELTNKEIEAAGVKFASWNKVVDAKLNQLNTDFIGGSKPSCGDYITYSVYSSFITNEHTEVKDLRESLRSEMAKTSAVQAWVKRM